MKQTLARLRGFCPVAHRYLVIPQSLRSVTRANTGKENIIIEPQRRNTAAAICLAALHIQKNHGPKSIIHVMPADHMIQPKSSFIKTLTFSHRYCKQGYCVTYGIQPDRPETGYGYIKIGKLLDKNRYGKAYKGLSFTEKPSHGVARRYLRTGKYLWNSGIFSFQAATIIGEIKNHAPQVYQGVIRYFKTKQRRYFERVPHISIDYAVMEKSDQLCIIQGTFSWDDVGSWLALERYFPKDAAGNILKGDIKGLEIDDSIIYTSDIPCKAYGIRGLIIVVSPHGVLVCSKDKAPDLKRLMNA